MLGLGSSFWGNVKGHRAFFSMTLTLLSPTLEEGAHHEGQPLQEQQAQGSHPSPQHVAGGCRLSSSEETSKACSYFIRYPGTQTDDQRPVVCHTSQVSTWDLTCVVLSGLKILEKPGDGHFQELVEPRKAFQRAPKQIIIFKVEEDNLSKNKQTKMPELSPSAQTFKAALVGL